MSNYKIVIETTKHKKTALDHYNFLKNHNITSDILTLDIDEGALYSVQAGPYAEKKYALEHVDRIKELGIRDAFITSEQIN